jgi:hypothetical protein
VETAMRNLLSKDEVQNNRIKNPQNIKLKYTKISLLHKRDYSKKVYIKDKNTNSFLVRIDGH